MSSSYVPRVNPFVFFVTLTLLAILYVLIFAQVAQAQVEEARIVPERARSFGRSLAISGNRAMIGAQDSVFVYARTAAATWEETALLTLEQPQPGDQLGTAVALDGDRALLTVFENALFTGFVYVYEYINGEWIKTAKLKAGNEGEVNGFGASLALQGDRAFIGAVRDNEKASHAGAVYVFELQDDNTWLETSKLTASDAHANGSFGDAISVDGNRVLIGAGDETIGEIGFSQGAAYIFEQQPAGEWLEVAKIFAADGDQHQYFGRAVALEGDRAVAGVTGATAAYVFDRQPDGSWINTQKLEPSDGNYPNYYLRDNYGVSLALEGDVLLVGADNNANYNNTYAGSVYIYKEQSDGTYEEVHKLIASDGYFSREYGSAIAMEGNVVLVGDRSNEAAEGVRGVVYAIDLDEPLKTVTSFTLINSATDTPIDLHDPIKQNSRVELHELPLALNVRANVAGDDVKSVAFHYLDDKGQPQTRIENGPPFAMLGDVGGDFAEGRLFLGEQIIRATPYNQPDAQGKAGTGALLHFYTEFYEPPQAVTSFTLIDPATDAPFEDYEYMRTDIILSLNLLPAAMNVRANTTGDKVTGVRFEHTHPAGHTTVHVEHTPPFTLFGDVDGDYAAGQFEPGDHIITATPFTYVGAGEDFEALTTTFTVVKGDPGIRVTGFYLVAIATGEDMYLMREDDRPNTARIGDDAFTQSRGFGIRAEVEGPVGSVHFELEPDGYTRIENAAPYALYGDENGAYLDSEWQAFVELTVTATPYRGPEASGVAGDPYRIHFMLNPGGGGRITPLAGTDVLKQSDEVLPADDFMLEPAYPNPFNNRTTLEFSLPEAQHVRLIVYDMLGREVARLVEDTLDPGSHVVHFDAGDLPSGTYVYRLQTPIEGLTGKLLLLK